MAGQFRAWLLLGFCCLLPLLVLIIAGVVSSRLGSWAPSIMTITYGWFLMVTAMLFAVFGGPIANALFKEKPTAYQDILYHRAVLVILFLGVTLTMLGFLDLMGLLRILK